VRGKFRQRRKKDNRRLGSRLNLRLLQRKRNDLTTRGGRDEKHTEFFYGMEQEGLWRHTNADVREKRENPKRKKTAHLMPITSWRNEFISKNTSYEIQESIRKTKTTEAVETRYPFLKDEGVGDRILGVQRTGKLELLLKLRR